MAKFPSRGEHQLLKMGSSEEVGGAGEDDEKPSKSVAPPAFKKRTAAGKNFRRRGRAGDSGSKKGVLSCLFIRSAVMCALFSVCLGGISNLGPVPSCPEDIAHLVTVDNL